MVEAVMTQTRTDNSCGEREETMAEGNRCLVQKSQQAEPSGRSVIHKQWTIVVSTEKATMAMNQRRR